MSYPGIDVSHHQNEIDWGEVKATGKVFAFMKATEGDDWTDPEFASYWQESKSVGLVRGAYHFFHADNDAKAQADHFIATVALEPGDLAPVLDVEIEEGMNPEEIVDEVRVWLERVEEAFGIRPILYSDQSFIEHDLVQGHFSEYPLWFAEYSSTEEPPDAPTGWENWTFWQSTQTGNVADIEGDVDLDEYHGSKAAWDRLLITAEAEKAQTP